MDVRGRVYGLLGLASGLSMDVDYSLTTLQVLERVMNACQCYPAADLFHSLAAALEVDDFQQFSNTPTQMRVPIEIHQCVTLKKLHGSWYWNDYPLRLFLSNHDDRPIEHGDLLYTLSLKFRSPSDVGSHGSACILVVQRAIDRAIIERSSGLSNYVAGTALIYDYHTYNYEPNLLREAIIHPKQFDERIMTLELDVEDLMYICDTFII
jgi:hypothetical protein